MSYHINDDNDLDADRSEDVAELLIPTAPVPSVPLIGFLPEAPLLEKNNDQTIIILGLSESAARRRDLSRQTSREDDRQQVERYGQIFGLNLHRLKFSNRIVLYIHLVSTLILLLLKILVAYLSSSMSIRSLVGDSAVDLVNLGLLLGASFLSGRHSQSHPLGRANLETLANFTMSLFMTGILFLVVYQSAIRLDEKAQYFFFDGPYPHTANITLSNAAVVGALILIKLFLLALCVTNPSAQTNILKKDHIVDIPMNFFALILGSIGSLGTRNQWTEKLIMIDDIGAILLALYGTYIWLPQILKHANRVCHPVVKDQDISDSVREAAERELTSIIKSGENVVLSDTIICHDGGDKIIIMQKMILPDTMAHQRVKEIFDGLTNTLKVIDNVSRVIVHWEF